MDESQRLARLVEHLPGMVYRCANDRYWTMELVSGQPEALTGYAPDELIGNKATSFALLILPGDRQRVWEDVQQAIADRSTYVTEYRLVRRDGEVRWVWESGRAVFDDRGQLEALEGYIQDITERKQLAATVRRSRQLSIADALASALGHDLSNLLSAAELAQIRLSKDHPAWKDLEKVESAASRAANLARRLVGLARNTPEPAGLVDVDQQLRELLPLLVHAAGPEHRVLLDLQAGPKIRAAASDVEQAVLNLVVNARHASPPGAPIVVSTAADPPGHERPMVRLTVSDRGPGFSAAIVQRAFEPFVTTKPFGEGTGLGLFSVRTAVERAGGSAQIAETGPKGSRVEVSWPVAA